MKKITRIVALLLVAIMVVSATACGTTTDNDSSDKTEGETNYLSVMLLNNVMSLDPNLATDGESFEVIADCVDGLMQMDADGAVMNALAESTEVSEDGCTYTFHLREAYWYTSTGEQYAQVTAGDFVFAWQRIAELAGEYAYMLSDIGQIVNAEAIIAGEMDKSELGVEATDDTTLVVHLNVPVSYFESLMYFPTFSPINQAFYESLDEGTFATSPETYLYNGAFVLESYTPGTASFKLVKNENYWDADRVQLEGLQYQVIGSSDDALTSFNANTLDIAVVSGDQVVAAQNDEDLADNLEVVGAGYLWYLSFSQTETNANGYLANENLRLAITNAIDREALVDNYVMDGSLATYTAVPPQFATSATTGEDFSADQDAFKDVCDFDAERAQDYYAKACEELGVDTFTFEIIYGNNEGDEVAKVAQAIKEQIEATLPGITINLSNMLKADRLDKMQNDNYEIALTRWGPDYADPMTYLGMWITNNSNNYGFWSNADYDALIADCTTGAYVSDYDARWQAMFDAETIVMNEAVIAPLYTKSNANLIADGVEGVEFHPMALNRVFKNATKTAD